MLFSQNVINALEPKTVIRVWPVRASNTEDAKKILLGLHESEYDYKIVGFRSLANILYSYLNKMSEQEKSIFESICSYFWPHYDNSGWVTNEAGEDPRQVLNLKQFSILLENALSETLPPNQIDTGNDIEKVSEFLKECSATYEYVILEVAWGKS
jgi:hypothetical protein